MNMCATEFSVGPTPCDTHEFPIIYMFSPWKAMGFPWETHGVFL